MPISSYAAPACLEWDASPDTVDGYFLHWDTDTSGPPYVNKIDVGNVLTYTVPSVVGPAWFAVTAHRDGVESGYSNEVTDTFVIAPPGGLRGCTP